MAQEISQIKTGGVLYDLADAIARKAIEDGAVYFVSVPLTDEEKKTIDKKYAIKDRIKNEFVRSEDGTTVEYIYIYKDQHVDSGSVYKMPITLPTDAEEKKMYLIAAEAGCEAGSNYIMLHTSIDSYIFIKSDAIIPDKALFAYTEAEETLDISKVELTIE